jgi:carboxyl-terminal processing protease
MKRKDLFKGVVIGFILSTIILTTSTAFINKQYYINRKLETIDALIENYYIGKVDKKKMEEGIYKGFVSGVGDVYTTYYTKEEMDDFKETSSGVYAGIGVQMTVDRTDNTISVIQVFKGSPAEAAGILPQDKIIKAAGKSVTGDDFEEVPKLIKGTPGTKVSVSIFRPSENKTYTFDLVRNNVTFPTVEYKLIDSDIGYIRITQFEEKTYDQFKEALDFIQEKNAKSLIIDVRNNSGGILSITNKIVDELIPEGVIVSTKDKIGNVETVRADKEYIDIPLVLLVNENSASASEILAGALKDHNRAKLVGETTFGKGLVQSVVPFEDGSGIKITTAQYYTPKDVCIQGIGIDPDYRVSLDPELLIRSSISEQEDAQLQKAIELLRK